MAKESLLSLNTKRWADCKVHPSKQASFDKVAKRLTAPEAVKRYKEVERWTGVPWWFIAVTHEREASQSWKANLAQGDPWNKKSTHVPAGRGPFKSWEDAAVDALVNCAPYAARNKDWSPANALTMLEKYNGLGYYNKGIPSPYVWAGTNQYIKGKYVADGVFNPNAVDQQLGCAGLLKAMKVFDKKEPSAVPPTAAVVVAGGTAAGATIATQAPAGHNYWWFWVGLGVVTLGLIGWGLIHWINKQEKKNEVA